MISEISRFIDKGNNYVCVSRPRRFGKTIASEMLSAYYSKGCDSRELFKGLKIYDDPSFSPKLGKYNVIKIDLNSEYQNTRDRNNLIEVLSNKIIEELRREFNDVIISDDQTLAEALFTVYSKTGQTFIIIIDEYDVLVREQVDDKLFSNYLSFLNGLFKSATLRPAISLAYLTGILSIVRGKVQSKLNNFEEYTILKAYELSEYIGFSDDEVKALCREYNAEGICRCAHGG